MQDKLITLLASQNSYPLGLAHELGIVHAVAVNEIIKLGGLGEVLQEPLFAKLQQTGMKNEEEVVWNLAKVGVIILDGAKVRINQEYFQELETLQVEIKKSIWQDKEFLGLLAKWKEVLRGKGTAKRSDKDYQDMFDGKDEESVKASLRYCIDNKFTTFYYRENNRPSSKSNSRDSGSRFVGGPGSRVAKDGEGTTKEGRTVHKGLKSLGDEEV